VAEAVVEAEAVVVDVTKIFEDLRMSTSANLFLFLLLSTRRSISKTVS